YAARTAPGAHRDITSAWTGGTLLPRGAKVLRPHRAATVIGDSDPYVAEPAVEDVRAVPGAVHPRVHDLGRARLAGRDVLADHRPAIARVGDPGRHVDAVGGRMREVVPRDHVGGVVAGGRRQLDVDGKRLAARLGPLTVDDQEHGVLGVHVGGL